MNNCPEQMWLTHSKETFSDLFRHNVNENRNTRAIVREKLNKTEGRKGVDINVR